jgi:hypothetical protein
MKVISFLTAVVLSTAPGLVAAQDPGYGGGAGGGMGGGTGGYGGHHKAGSGQLQELEGITVDPVVWNGPPDSAALPPTIHLTADQQPRYTELHANFMAATKRVRDQSLVTRQIIYGGSPQQRTSSPTAIEDYKEQALYLSQKQDVFDQALESFLTKDQLKEYQKWRKAERKRAEKEQQAHAEDGRGKGRPPD